VHQGVDDVLEHDAIGDALAVTAQRMRGVKLWFFGQQRGELDPDRLDDR
jgi:hypothetical protein